MSDLEKRVLKTMIDATPLMSDSQKSRIIGYGEAILDIKEEKEKKVTNKKESDGKEN